MLYTLSYQMYKYEHGLHSSAAERRAADVRAGEIAAALHELRLSVGRAFRPRRRGRPSGRPADPVTAQARFMPSVR